MVIPCTIWKHGILKRTILGIVISKRMNSSGIPRLKVPVVGMSGFTDTKGTWTWDAKARFYPGVDLDVLTGKGWHQENEATMARGLWSTTDAATINDLHAGSGEVPHKLVYSWNCCQGDPNHVNQNTKVTEQIPARTAP